MMDHICHENEIECVATKRHLLVIPGLNLKRCVLFDGPCSHAFRWFYSTTACPIRPLQPIEVISRSAAEIQQHGRARERNTPGKLVDDSIGVCPAMIVCPTGDVIIDHRPYARRSLALVTGRAVFSSRFISDDCSGQESEKKKYRCGEPCSSAELLSE